MEEKCRPLPLWSVSGEMPSPSEYPVSRDASYHAQMEAIVSGPGGSEGEADEDGDVLAEGLMDADADDDGDTLAETLALGLGLNDGDRDALGDCDADGLIDALGLGDELTLADGETDAEGDGDGEPIALTSIVAHTFTPLVAPRVENVCTQN